MISNGRREGCKANGLPLSWKKMHTSQPSKIPNYIGNTYNNTSIILVIIYLTKLIMRTRQMKEVIKGETEQHVVTANTVW